MDCPKCEKEVMPDSFFCSWCSVYMPAPEKGMKAGLFRRWVALIIDPLIAVLLYLVATFVLGGLLTGVLGEAGALVTGLIMIFFPLAYFIWFLTLLRKGLTPGKMLLGLQVVKDQTGNIPGFWVMVLREIVGRFLSGVLGGLGYLWALIDKNAQAWHDKLAGTVVLKVTK